MALKDKFEDMENASAPASAPAEAEAPQTAVAPAAPQPQLPANAVLGGMVSLRKMQDVLDIRAVTNGMTVSACIAGKLIMGDDKIGTWLTFKPLTWSYEWVAQADREAKDEETRRLEKRGPDEHHAYDGTLLEDHVAYLKNTMGFPKAAIQKRIKIVGVLLDSEVKPKDFDPNHPYKFYFSLPLTSSNNWDRLMNSLDLDAMIGMAQPFQSIKAFVDDFSSKGRDYSAVNFKVQY